MAGKKSDAVLAAQAKLWQRVDRQLLVVEAFIRANQQVDAAHARLKTIEEENQARAAEAEEAIGARKRERAETLAGLAMVVNDDDETAGLVDVTVAEVRSARRSVSADRAREVAARAARQSAAPGNGTKRPANPTRGT